MKLNLKSPSGSSRCLRPKGCFLLWAGTLHELRQYFLRHQPLELSLQTAKGPSELLLHLIEPGFSQPPRYHNGIFPWINGWSDPRSGEEKSQATNLSSQYLTRCFLPHSIAIFKGAQAPTSRSYSSIPWYVYYVCPSNAPLNAPITLSARPANTIMQGLRASDRRCIETCTQQHKPWKRLKTRKKSGNRASSSELNFLVQHVQPSSSQWLPRVSTQSALANGGGRPFPLSC